MYLYVYSHNLYGLLCPQTLFRVLPSELGLLNHNDDQPGLENLEFSQNEEEKIKRNISHNKMQEVMKKKIQE